jgi:hypothetical protein
MRDVAGRFGAGQVQHLGDDPDRKRGAARLARLVTQQAFDALLSVSHLPAPDRRSTGARAPRHFLNRQMIGRTKHNLRPPHMFERAIAIRDDGQQMLAIFGGRKDTDGLSHAHRLAHSAPFCESSDCVTAPAAKFAKKFGPPENKDAMAARLASAQEDGKKPLKYATIIRITGRLGLTFSLEMAR